MSTHEMLQVNYISKHYGEEMARLVRDECQKTPPSERVEPFVVLRRLRRMKDAERYPPPAEGEDMSTNTD
jgi:hypothetical protein